MVVIVGQAPSSKSCRPLDGASGRRIAALAGLGGVGELRSRARLLNLVRRFPGKAGKGDAFPLVEARAAAAKIRIPRGSTVVLLGRGVASAFGFAPSASFFRESSRRGSRVFVAPHPSGISRWWNDPANVERARAFWREVLA